MVERRDVGSWLEGPAAQPGSGDIGLPADGPGSIAGFARRLAALVVDWLACLLVSAAFFRSNAMPVVGGDPVATLAIFAVENVVLVGTLGHTLGHRLLGIRVRRLAFGDRAREGMALPDDGRAPGVVRAAARTALLVLVVPAAIQDAAGRGLHDRVAGTAIVRR